MKPLFTLKGYWNGEHTASFTACIVKPIENKEKPMYWHNVFSGQERQALEVTYGGQTWFMDNNAGDAHYKVTAGMGSPSCGHKSYHDCEFVRYIPQEEMKATTYPFGEREERELIEAYQKEKDPVEFERMQSLIRSMNEFTRMSPMEKVQHISKNMVKPASPNRAFNFSGKKDGRGKR